MNASATIRNSEDVFVIVSGDMFDGSEYALVAIATSYRTAWCRPGLVVVVKKRKEWDAGGRW